MAFDVPHLERGPRFRILTCFSQAAPILDSLLFKTFREAFGGRVRFIVSGGAPLATHIEQFLSVTLCAPVFQASALSLIQGMPAVHRDAVSP